MMDLQNLFTNKNVRPFLLNARFGVEKESQRVTLDGKLAKTAHPKVLGERNYHPYIQTDFAETQMELITPVANSPQELMDWLAAIHDVAYRSMDKNELLWPLSMPPALPEDEYEIQIAKLDNFEDVLYRRYLAKAYGRRKQMVSGIHYNFEFGTELMATLFDNQTDYQDAQEFMTAVYLKVTRNYLRYRWLITYLYGATPASDENYFVEQAGPVEPVRSIRNSQYGYTNHPEVKVSYESLTKYLADIAEMVDTGKLSEEKEFYAPVRLRGGQQVKDLAANGIHYIELRNIDIQPFDRYGISEEEVRFLQLFLLLMAWLPEEKPADLWVTEGDLMNNQVSLEKPFNQTAFLEEGQWLLAEMEKMLLAVEIDLPADFLDFAKARLADVTLTPAAQLWQASKKHSQKSIALELARVHQEASWARPYQLAGFTEMELSTQIMIFDGIQKGVKVEVLDKNDQFLKLVLKDHVEYVKNANMTSKDSYVVPLMMANKTVTKKVLGAAGFRVPAGAEFANLAEALASYGQFAKQAIVVKPKSTNYGLGISVFKEGASKADFEEAVRIAFAEDDNILVEEYLPGTEYRFFVLAGQVKAIMLRVPANIEGDGTHTIEELMAIKNQDPLRGTHHRSPLELIQLGPIEKLMLKEQGYQATSIPKQGEVIYLRENSNVSTGGDSIDMTDDFHEDYKKVAADAVKALGAAISGIDLIIPDKEVPANQPGAYGIIEANFNPAMHMHVYPFKGTGQRLTMDVLNFLFPELAKFN